MQESGVPNVTGGFGGDSYEGGYDYGIFYASGGGHGNKGGGGGCIHYADLSRGSNLYINNLKEIRVKSIISIGFIKLY